MSLQPHLVGEADQHRAFWDQHLDGLIDIQRNALPSGSAKAWIELLNDLQEMPSGICASIAAAAVQRLCRSES